MNMSLIVKLKKKNDRTEVTVKVDDNRVADLSYVMIHGFQHLEPDEKTYLKFYVLYDSD